jgi:UDP-N-acetylmuramate dehydrogenase
MKEFSMSRSFGLVVETDKCLQLYNSLGLSSVASHFCVASSIAKIQEALTYAKAKQLDIMPLGAGSNVVFASDLRCLAVCISILGIKESGSNGGTPNSVDVRFAAGENWDRAVRHCLSQGWYGLENLARIPGNVGASVIQNIGAYGVEISDRFLSLSAVKIDTGEIIILNKDQCRFSYRESAFKQLLKDKFIITHVTLRLSRIPIINIDYPALTHYFADHQGEISSEMVYEAVSTIRQSKLPDPDVLPNVGSFFKNPVLSASTLAKIDSKDGRTKGQIPRFEQPQGCFKVPAGWLIEQLGLKGLRYGAAGIHAQQALVLVNYQNGKKDDCARDILALARYIQEKVLATFFIQLEIEPRIYGSV